MKEELMRGNFVAFRVKGIKDFFKLNDKVVSKYNVRVAYVNTFGLKGIYLEIKDAFNNITDHYIPYSDITIIN